MSQTILDFESLFLFGATKWLLQSLRMSKFDGFSVITQFFGTRLQKTSWADDVDELGA